MNKSIPKVALITGANKGTGFEIVRQLGRSGAVVLVGAQSIADEFGHLDILVNNAGIISPGDPSRDHTVDTQLLRGDHLVPTLSKQKEKENAIR